MSTATLSREAILAMEAGAEMDAWVACKVTGLEECAAGYPAYSTDIAAAWDVVEKMRAYSPVVCLWEDFNDEAGPFRCELTPPPHRCSRCRNTQSRNVEAWASTAPLAICRAALLATPGAEA